MLVVAAGSLLPSLEDWFGARRELRVIGPLLDELGRRHPDVGIGVRPRGPLVFRVAERMSLISDALFLEATAARSALRRVDSVGSAADPDEPRDSGDCEDSEDSPQVSPGEQAAAVASWICAGRDGETDAGRAAFPGLAWLRQPPSYSDREWILEIADQYRHDMAYARHYWETDFFELGLAARCAILMARTLGQAFFQMAHARQGARGDRRR